MKKLLIAFIGLILLSCTTSEDNEVSGQLNVHINQVGYLPVEDKYFMVDNYDGGFSIIDENGSSVYSGKTILWKKNDFSSGMDLYKGDFTEFTDEGAYIIKLDDESKSYKFNISNSVFNETRNLSLKSFYLQRASIELNESHAYEFKRPAGHVDELKYHPSSPIKGTKDVSGGWYDAGDFGRYITPGAVSLGVMMMGYEQYPEKFDFDDNNIPESGNGISDFLDEMRFELEWMLKMQYTEEGEFKGALPYMVNSKDYVWEMPHVGSQNQYIYDFSSISTATFTAVMAQGSRLFKEVDEEFANKCLDAAKLSWSWLENNGQYPAGGFQRPSDTQTGGYAYSAADNKIDKDDRLWAAVELFLTTGDSRYHDYLDSGLKGSTNSGWGMSWMDTIGYAKLQYLMSKHPGVDSNIKSKLEKDFLKHCDSLVKNADKDGFKTALTRNDYYWGSNGVVLNRANHLINAYILTGDKKYHNAALYQLNYVLGMNGHNMSYVAGLGSVYPENIHHSVTANDDTSGSFPGLIAGGPNQYLDNDYTLPNYYNQMTPPALCYIDHIDSWASNENCITYNAPLIPVSAYFSN